MMRATLPDGIEVRRAGAPGPVRDFGMINAVNRDPLDEDVMRFHEASLPKPDLHHVAPRRRAAD
jgi:hypothetical protein